MVFLAVMFFFTKNKILVYPYGEIPYFYKRTPSILTEDEAKKDFLRNQHEFKFKENAVPEDLNFPDLEQSKMASIALDNCLYVHGWTMFYELHNMKTFPSRDSLMVLAEVNGEYVGTCVYKKLENRIAIFVKESFRNKNIGSKLLNHTISKFNLNKDEIFAGLGNSESVNFFKKNKILAYAYGCVPLMKTVEELVQEEFAMNTKNQSLVNFLKKSHQNSFSEQMEAV